MRADFLLAIAAVPAVSSLCATACFAQATPHAAGAYYYPWWGDGVNPNQGHGWQHTLPNHLNPQVTPTAGYTSSNNQATITAHIQQSLRANIGLCSLSWWGPNSYEDKAIRNTIFQNPNVDKLRYNVIYETEGRLGGHTTPDYTKRQSDFDYMAQNLFTNPNYERINGRPVVYMYLTRVYFTNNATGTTTNGTTQTTITGKQALANLKTFMQTKYGYVPYIVGDNVFGSNPVGPAGSNIDQSQIKQFDAVTTYDVYGSSGAPALTNDGVALDLADNNDAVASLQTAGGVTFTIDFGNPGAANRLDWTTAADLLGQYQVADFDIGTDVLRLGTAAGTFAMGDMARIVIDSVGYSATAKTSAYWDTDAGGYVVFHNAAGVPEPAALLGLIAVAGLGGRRPLH